MSKLIVDQDWETNESPFTFSGVAMARSATNAMDGTDVRGGNGGANSGQAAYSLVSGIDLPSSGSRRGLRVYGYFKFKRVSGPTGGTVPVMSLTGADATVTINILDGTTVLEGGVSGSTSLTAGSENRIDFDYREERNGYRFRIWLNGALEIDFSSASSPLQRVSTISFGTSSTKITWEFVWGRMKIWTAYDPQ